MSRFTPSLQSSSSSSPFPIILYLRVTVLSEGGQFLREDSPVS